MLLLEKSVKNWKNNESFESTFGKYFGVGRCGEWHFQQYILINFKNIGRSKRSIWSRNTKLKVSLTNELI